MHQASGIPPSTYAAPMSASRTSARTLLDISRLTGHELVSSDHIEIIDRRGVRGSVKRNTSNPALKVACVRVALETI